MTQTTSLMIEDVAGLRRKLGEARGSLAAKWRSFQVLAEHQSDRHPLYPAFAALVTEDPRWGRLFRDRLEEKVNRLPVAALPASCQFHTWCWSAPLARWAMAYDWVADQPAFATFDHGRCADAFIDAIYSQVYPRVLGRVPASDNQIGSMLLACGVIGYLFGVKRGSDPRAVALYQVAMSRASEISGLAEPQFVGEGSTYMVGVNTAVMGLWYVFLRWLEKPLDRATWLSCQESARNVIAPGGLTLGWDAGGNARAPNMAGLALLARETDDAAPLAIVDHLDMWHGIDHCAWHEDQRLWTLAWWPEGSPDWPAECVPPEQMFPGWFHPEIGGVIDGMNQRVRLAQLWDKCDGTRVGSVGRPNTDPSALALFIGGSPMLLDGMPTGTVAAFNYPSEQMVTEEELADLENFIALRRQATGKELRLEDLLSRFAHGCIGGSNALVFNREPWYYPRKQVHGKGTLWARLRRVQAVGADCAEHYLPRYPVQRVERASILLDQRCILVIDAIDASEEVRVDWQAFVRHERVSLQEGKLTARTPEGPALTIIPEDDGAMETSDIDCYPKPFGASTRVAWSKPVTRGTLATLLVPHDDERMGTNASIWEGALALDREVSNATVPPVTEWTAHGSLEEVIETLWAAPSAEWRILRCKMSAPAGADYLRIPLLNEAAGLWWNGRSIISPHEEVAQKGWGRCLPLALEAEGGQGELVIATRCHLGCLQVGTGEWYRRSPLPEFTMETGDDTWTLRSSDWSCTVSTGAGAAKRGWATDAKWVFEFGDGEAALLSATKAKHAAYPEFRAEFLSHGELASGQWDGISTALPEIERPWQAKPFASDEAACGGSLAQTPETRSVCQAIVALDADELITLLDHGDWRVQRAAIERVGCLRLQNALPRLRELLSKEVTLILDQPPPAEAVPSGNWAADMRALGRNPANRRFRVLQALIISLKQLGDSVSLPAVRQLLETTHHFYPVYKAGLEFLAELGTVEDRPTLEAWTDYPETNASTTAKTALECANGESSIPETNAHRVPGQSTNACTSK